MGITAMILGIASLVLGLNGSYTWGILAVAGLVCAIISFTYQKKAKAEGQEDGFTKAAKITSIIGLVFCIIGILWGLICGICTCVASTALQAAAVTATAMESSEINEGINNAINNSIDTDDLANQINDAVNDALKNVK